MLVQSYILLIPIGYGPTMQVKYLEIWLHLSLQMDLKELALWSVRGVGGRILLL